MIVFVLAGGGIAVVPWVLAMSRRRRRRQYAHWVPHGVPGSALVTDLVSHAQTMSSISSGPPLTTYAPVLRFTLPDGRVIETESAHRSSPPAGRPGQVVEIRYDANDPTRVVAVNTPALALVHALSSVVGVLLIVGCTVVGGVLVAAGVVALSAGAPLWP